MTKGSKRQNYGPCVVCGLIDSNVKYRKLNVESLRKTTNSPKFHLVTTKLEVGQQLCQKDWNQLVIYDRNAYSPKKKQSKTPDKSSSEN
ncbi:4168_t:CDS:2 [Entrophospora sp. SA101]|nr:10125_t:CDS:2 [Entrophospora sp. SA101]CAJ0758650.1 4168_t:CDS:2 [Entrophospora sp. SA101]CAJ0838989.1 2306_t:CDS:2 [Entrophospora sp. SA101]CAJ0844448.1 10582_t:CDS:2 [Entrophospora sp. SA101]CAJ0925206.1 12119_t:CDS:2 [Entrophospora sp. SA101]